MKVQDPVCGMQCDDKDAVGKSDYRGQTYYFCARGCKAQFDADPARFAGTKGPGTYLPQDNVRHEAAPTK